MKIQILLTVMVMGLVGFQAHAQITGKWKTIDDTDGVEKSIIEIYEKGGKLYGRVDQLLPAAKIHTCDKCDGDKKGKPLTGMVILWDLTPKRSGAVDGRILDPASGKEYACDIELETPDKLKVRGYIGLPAFGRSQYWHRAR